MKQIEIKKKFINHLMINGKKNTSEKIILQSFKELQKISLKKTNDLIKLAVIYSIPIFKLNIIRNKKSKKRKFKEVPSFISNNSYRISLAIKFIIATINDKKENIKNKLTKEIILCSQQKGNTVLAKNNLQKNILLKKKFLNFYRWR